MTCARDARSGRVRVDRCKAAPCVCRKHAFAHRDYGGEAFDDEYRRDGIVQQDQRFQAALMAAGYKRG